MRRPFAAERLFDWPLDALLAAMPDEADPVWDADPLRQHALHHRQTRSIRIVWLDKLVRDAVPETIGNVPAALRDAALAWGTAIADHYGGTLLRLLAVEMAPGTSILPHVDGGMLLTLTHRCHLPVLTNPGVRFEVDGKPYHFAAGEVWEFDNLRLHAVANHGETRRVHLICNVLHPAIPFG